MREDGGHMASRIRSIGKVTGAAVTTAPYVRRLATDEELRSDLSGLLQSAAHLYRDISQDTRIRQDVRSMAESLRDGTDRMRQDIRPRDRSRTGLYVGAGMVLATLAIIAALAYPRSRQSMTRFAGETRQRASSTVHDVRERFGGGGMEQAA